MNKKESFSDIARENEFIKTLFNFTNFQERNNTDLKNTVLSFLQISKNGPNYFINLIDHYSICRPQYPDLSNLFVKCVFLCFPETTEQESQQKYNLTMNNFGSSQKIKEPGKKKNDFFSLFPKNDEPVDTINYSIKQRELKKKMNGIKLLFILHAGKGNSELLNISLKKVLILKQKILIRKLRLILHGKIVIFQLFIILLKKVLILKQTMDIFFIHV